MVYERVHERRAGQLLAALRACIAVVFTLIACRASAVQEHRPAADFDVLITNASVYDGSRGVARSVNIGIRGDLIASMNAPPDATARRIIDASGKTVTPGFIDPHTHADADIFNPPGNANSHYLLQGVTTVFIGNDGNGLREREAQLAQLNATGVGTNVGWFSGHGSVREAALGLADRAPDSVELQAMRSHVEADMRAGALGLSTGLFYRPGSYSQTDEVIELARVAARFGGVYDSHIRDESSYSIGLIAAVEELIRISESAGLPGHIAHIKALGRDVWGQSEAIVELVDTARDRGVAITADQYPWRASGTRLSAALLPRWAQADSQAAMLERINDATQQPRILEAMRENLWRRGGADSLLITGAGPWQGRTLARVAADSGQEDLLAAIAIISNGDPAVASFNMTAEDIATFATQSWVMTGSDGSEGHPRKYASYPKAYLDFVLDSKVMTLAHFVHRSSGLVADTYGLCDRGYLRVGRRADIAIIDLADYRPRADFAEPRRVASGIDFLLVNGALAIADGTLQQSRHGEVINRQNLDCAP